MANHFILNLRVYAVLLISTQFYNDSALKS